MLHGAMGSMDRRRAQRVVYPALAIGEHRPRLERSRAERSASSTGVLDVRRAAPREYGSNSPRNASAVGAESRDTP